MDWLLDFDLAAFRAIHDGLRNPAIGVCMLILSYSGLGQVQAAFALLLLTSKKTKFYTLPLLTTILVSGLPVTHGLKRLFGRERPSNLALSIPEEPHLGWSFPSGHTITSFAIAWMLFLMTYRSKNAWIGQLALVWALLVGVSRIYRGVHWPTDVLAGACAGIFSSCLVYVVLRKLGKQLHLDTPEASLSGQEVAR